MQNLVGKYLVIVFAMMTTKINGIREVGIGVILDMDSNVGKSCRVSILMALEEFYGAPYNNFTTIIHPHFHDSKSSNFEAASVEVGIGVILDMDSNVGKSCRVSILMALEEFYGAPYNNFTTIIHPHFHDSKSSNFEAASVGYAWIITDVLTGLLHYLDRQDIDSMQGVIGVKPYIPPSDQLNKFEKKWRKRFYKEYPEMDRAQLDMFGIWYYDSIFAIATALQRVEAELSATLNRPMEALPDLASIETSQLRSRILPKIQNIRLKGLGGDFHVINGQLQTSPYQIVNVFGNGEKQVGLWNSMNKGLSNQTSQTHKLDYTTNIYDLGTIIWPGDTPKIPKVHEIPYCDENMQLRVGVPANSGFVEFIEVYKDHKTNEIHASGLCMDILYAVLDALPCRVNYKLFLYETHDDKRSRDYNEFVYQVFNGTYDMVIGDVTILSNRSNYVDFTLPYSQSGVAILVPLKADKRKNAWIFMEPLETKLWITIGAFFIYTGFVVWVIEHRGNKEFRGPPNQQVGMIFWFSFSTLVFAHIQKLQPAFRTINELITRGDYIGYQSGSFVEGLLKDMSVQSDRLKKYINFFEYAQALSNGSQNGGVSAIVDEVPYLKMLQAKNCSKYFMLDPIYKTAGFGFALPKGSPLVAEFSKAILKVVEGPLTNLTNKWIGDGVDCSEQDSELQDFDKLTLASFKGLFFIAGLSSTYALVVFIFMFLYENKDILMSESSMHEKLTAIIRNFDEDKNKKPAVLETMDDSHVQVEVVDDNQAHDEENITQAPPLSPRTSIDHQGVPLSHDSPVRS
ncbi:Extracellular ligand-binding receptor [Artemisia annua]|uniref:Glutamate receptor n=1 Tax=Artemisia annua TaxID=35608 RepID=A0A2U1PUC7_ARTAN|nr:Extracellular ligand-binding receptor [Artemisia annua]